MREDLRAMLIREEGLRLRLYKDSVGKFTIGVGHNIEDNGITEAAAYFILDEDIAKASTEALKLPVFIILDQVRQDVIVNMIFNMGLSGVMGFKYMLAALSVQDWEEAAIQMLNSKWASQVGNRALELAAMIRTGEYQ